MIKHTLIRQIEDAAMNALPTARAVLYDQWVVRVANSGMGHNDPRRANSVHVVGASSLPLADKLTRVEALYSEAGLESIFKITPLVDEALSAALAARGYQRDESSITWVQTRDLTDFVPVPTLHRVSAEEHMSNAWLAAQINVCVETRARLEGLRGLWQELSVPARFTRILRDDQTAAVGLAIADGAYLGLFAIAVDASLRRQGFGAALIGDLLAWGQQHGCTTAYLQVSATNEAALALYARNGFTDAYLYWYTHRGNL